MFHRPRKYKAEAPNPIIRFRKYKPFEYITITAVLNHGERKNLNLLRKLNNRQALPGIKLNVPHRLKAMGEAELGTRGHGEFFLVVCGPEMKGLTEYCGSQPSLQLSTAQEVKRLATEGQQKIT